MLNLTRQQLINHMVKYNTKVIAYKTYESEAKFISKYKIGSTWLLGDVNGVVKNVEYYSKAIKKYGLVIFDFSRYNVVLKDLEERKVDKKI